MTEKASNDSAGEIEEVTEGVVDDLEGQADAELSPESESASEAEPELDADPDEETESESPAESAVAEEVPEDSSSPERTQADFDSLSDRHLRLVADFANVKRRQETQMTAAWGRAQAELVGRFVGALDDLQRVALLDPADEAVTVESIVEGIDLVERKFRRMLEDAGVVILDPVGEPFDPEIMEAMMRVPAESEEDDDRVADVFAKGYLLQGNLIRAARVSVFKAD